MSRSRSSNQPELPDESRFTDRGDTLIEVLLALVILGIAGVALLTGFATSITASGTHRNLATLDTSVRTASNEAISEVQTAASSVFGPNTCTNAAANPATNTSYSPAWNLSGSFTVTSYNVEYWNGTGFSNSCTSPNGLYGPQLWTMNIASSGFSSQVSTVIYDPGAPAVPGGTTPSKLVFMQPTSSNSGTGTVNATVSPQPIVAVEDSSSNIVYSDASSVTLTASGGTGSLSSNCTGVENNGVVSFSGAASVPRQLHRDGLRWVSGHCDRLVLDHHRAGSEGGLHLFTDHDTGRLGQCGTNVVKVQEQDAFGAPVAGALTVNLSSSSSTGMFSLASGGTTPITSVSIPAGQSSASFYYGDTTAGSPVLSASASGLQTGMQTETINGAAPVKVALTATPTSAGVSSTTDVALGLQLVDQFGNNTTAGSNGISLTLSTSSTKGFFNANNNASGSATATVAFASGAGTATEYYGDRDRGQSDHHGQERHELLGYHAADDDRRSSRHDHAQLGLRTVHAREHRLHQSASDHRHGRLGQPRAGGQRDLLGAGERCLGHLRDLLGRKSPDLPVPGHDQCQRSGQRAGHDGQHDFGRIQRLCLGDRRPTP